MQAELSQSESLPCVLGVGLASGVISTLTRKLAGSLSWEIVPSAESLSAKAGQGLLQGDAVLLGADLEEPLRIAQRVHAFDKTIPVLILTEASRCDELRRRIMFTPLLGTEVTPWSIADLDGLPQALTRAVERHGQRRNYLDTLASAQPRLGNLSLSQPEVTHYLDRLLDQAPIGVLSVDRTGRILGINRQAGRILGVAEREALGVPLAEFFPDTARKRLADLLARSAATNELDMRPEVLESIAVGSEARFLEATASPIAYHAGQRGFMLIFQDVTAREQAERERQRAETDLRQHASTLRAFHEISSTQALELTAKLQRLIKLCCERFELSIGLLSSIAGDRYEILMSTVNQGPYATGQVHRLHDTYCAAAVHTAEPIGFENAEIRQRQGYAVCTHPTEAYFGVRVMVGGEVFGILCFCSLQPREMPFSTTDKEVLKLMAQWMGNELQREQAEAHMRKLSSALEQTADPVMITDKHRLIEYVNPAFEKLTGYSKEEALGQKTYFLRSGVHDKAHYDALWHTISAGNVFRGVLVNRKKDGTTYHEEKTITPLRDAMGEITHYISTGHDITERKKAEEATRLHHAELAHVARLSTLGEMSSGISHELSQPLCAIMTYAQTCLRIIHDDDPSPDRVRYGLECVVEQAKLASEIFSRLRDFARKGNYVRRPVNIRSVVQDVAALMRADLAHREVILSIESGAATPHAHVDPIQIEQVILNLVRNGMDAVADSDSTRKRLTIRVAEHGPAEVKVSVCDSGRGCAAHVADRLFEPFYTTKPAGLGIGLPISQTIVEDHGGRLWLEENGTSGATFSFTLPYAEGASA